MDLTPLHLGTILALVIFLIGLFGYARDRRRITPDALMLSGAALGIFSALLWLDAEGLFGNLPVLLVVLGIALPVLGYPLLTLFLIANGVTMARRESRSLGNLLSLLLGLLLATWYLIPLGLETLGAPQPLVFVAAWLGMGYGLILGAYFIFFLIAAIAYRRIPARLDASHVIVLGAGLIDGKVPPLLASRLDKAVEVAQRQKPPATLVPSGGQGADESRPEGVAMAEYLGERGVASERIIVEKQSATTQENLLFSLELLPEKRKDLAVVTSDYHVFRAALLTRRLGIAAQVIGAKTAAYYVPSAFLREFVAALRQHLKSAAVLPALWTLLILGVAALTLVV